MLSFAEVQALRKQQEDLLNNKAENPVPVPPVPENKGKNMEKSAEQIELEKLKLELQEKNKKHQENYNQRESTIKLIEEIKTKQN